MVQALLVGEAVTWFGDGVGEMRGPGTRNLNAH